MYGSAQGTSSTQSAGVNIAVEAGQEWQIQEIGYDGVEKYIRPPTYSDHVAKMAHKVDWRKLVGSDASYDNPNALTRVESSDKSSEEDADTEAALSEEVEKPKLEMDDRKVPDAGPWHTVAKNLHEGLQQINVLVDTLAVLKMPYLEALTVMDSFEMLHNMHDVVQQSKMFNWVAKRKSLLEAIAVLEQSQKLRPKSDSEVESDREIFFRELKKMREQWRVRKTGNVVYGDLGYRIFGSKYNPSELFDISRKSLALPSPTSECDSSSAARSVLQVQVPCDLIRRSSIAVSIEVDDMQSKDLFATAENDLDYMRVEREKATEVHWSLALQWAQESLICRDIFNELSKEAVLLKEHIAMVRDGVMVVSLFDNILLRIELSLHPFQEGDIPQKGDEYLSRCLRELFVNEQCTRYVRHQMFIAMPLTTLAESLDLRGPYAMSAPETESRNRPKRLLLEQLMSIAAHYVLTKKVTSTLERYLLRVSDPQVSWSWLRSTMAMSAIIVTASNRNYDYIGKTTFYIRIEADEFYVMTKEGQRIDCRRDDDMLTYTIEYQICSYMLNSVAMVVGKLWQWQVLHANINAIDDEAEPSPTLYICNQSATRAIFMQFHMKAPPSIRVRKCSPEKTVINDESDNFILLNYNRLIGSSLCRKIDNLCAMLSN